MNDSGSSSSGTVHYEQLRTGHICAILVRNVSLRPTRDRAFQTLTSQRPGVQGDVHTTSDDADLSISLAKTNSKGKQKALSSLSRSRSATWTRSIGTTSDEDVVSTPTRPRFRGDVNARQHSASSVPRLPFPSSRRDADAEALDQSPRPILKRASTTREGDREPRYADFLDGYSPGRAGDPNTTGGYEGSLLSRSDSRNSSRSSLTVRRPEHRTRTASMTSNRSVRFDTATSTYPDARRSPRLSGKITNASRLMLFSDKSPAQIVQERLLECYVELALPSGSLKAMPSAAFYKSPISLPGLHHSWGSQSGPPIMPERDFGDIGTAKQSPLEASLLWLRLWARQVGLGKGDTWKVVRESLVDLRELTPLPNYAQDPSVPLPHNSVILGLAPGANSLTGRDSFRFPTSDEIKVGGDPKKPAASMGDDESERMRRILDNVEYFAIPIAEGENASTSRRTDVTQNPGRMASGRGTMGEGYASDPEAAPSGLSERAERHTVLPGHRRKAFLEEQRRVTELSLRQTKMMPSYIIDQARAIVKKQSQMILMEQEISRCKSQQSALLSEPSGSVQLKLQRNQRSARLQELRSMCKEEARDCLIKQTELDERKTKLAARRGALHASRKLLDKQSRDRVKLELVNRALHAREAELLAQMHSAHARLLHDLEIIFPIELLDASSLLFGICGLPLPNAVSSVSTAELDNEERQWREAMKQVPASSRPLFQAFDDDTISSALGLVAQLVILLSTYLSTPVHYPIATAGSRAVIQDCISLMSGPRAFPLYSKGVDRYRYDYAAFLLNKDIEQLMNVHSVTIIDIRHTLPNLKNLMVTVAAASATSHLTRKSHIGKSEISLRSNSGTPLSQGREPTRQAVDLPAAASKVKQGFGLGLGLPTSIKATSVSEDADNDPRNNSVPEAGTIRAGTSDTLVTTRVLGSTKTTAQGGGAIDSVARALSYFGGSRRG